MSLSFVKTEIGDDPIVVEGYFAATPEKVFDAWTTPESVMKWFGYTPNSLHSAAIDLKPGGAWQFLMTKNDEKSVGFEGEYLDIEPAHRLVFSWTHVVAHSNGEREETPYSKVDVTFTAKGGGTDVRLIHSAIQSEDARKGVGGGWEAAFANISAAVRE